MSECLIKLKEGALACLDNAERLIEDAETLLEKRSFLSCFLLTQLASEELAKGLKLIEKDSKNKKFSKKEWKSFTTKGRAHVNKLEYLQEVEDEWTVGVTRELRPELDYFQLLKKIATRLPWAGTVNKYRKIMSKTYYNWRIQSLYVEYDWTTKQWLEPLKQPVFDGIFMDEVICNSSILRTKHLSSVLRAKIRD